MLLGWGERGLRRNTLIVPVLLAFFAPFEKLRGWRAQKCHHLCEVLFVIEYLIFFLQRISGRLQGNPMSKLAQL